MQAGGGQRPARPGPGRTTEIWLRQDADTDQPGGVVHAEDDEPAIAELAHTLARVYPGRQAEQPVVRVIADPCQCLGEQVERVVGQAWHLAQDGFLQARPVGHAWRRSWM